MSLPKLQGYKINHEMASGGMAKIYDAIQISLNRSVAIKFLSKTLLDHHEAISLFESESLIIAQLNHPNIVQVIDKGISSDSQPYFVMEKINGIDLSVMINEAELPFSKKIDIAIQTSKGLAYAHKNNVIHRDIKPANIIIDQHGNAKILDFGIALSNEPTTNTQQSIEKSSVVGTEGYIAPEQQNDYTQATIESDIYSFGMLLKNLFNQKIDDHNNLSALPKSLIQLINQCTHTEPSKRFSSLTEVRDCLLKVSQGSHLNKTKFEDAKKDTQDLSAQFNLLDVLCKSHQKRVYLFQKKSNQQLIVIKRLLANTNGLKQAKLFSSLKHPNIVEIYAAAKNNGNFVLITEYLSGGSLENQLLKDMNEQDFLTQACQITSAIHFAHQNNIQHQNLSPANILFDSRQNIKVGDFGQTRKNKDNLDVLNKYHPQGNQAFSEQYDIYCLGAIFHHMLYGVTPNEKKPAVQRKLSFRIQKLIDQMLAINPINRPTTAQQILVELQRIARGNNDKNKKSNISKRHTKTVKQTKDLKIRPKEKEQLQSKKLSIALGISLILIVVLLLKDFVK